VQNGLQFERSSNDFSLAILIDQVNLETIAFFIAAFDL